MINVKWSGNSSGCRAYARGFHAISGHAVVASVAIVHDEPNVQPTLYLTREQFLARVSHQCDTTRVLCFRSGTLSR